MTNLLETIKDRLRGVMLTDAEAHELHSAIALCTREPSEPPAPRWIQLPATKAMPIVRIGRRPRSGVVTLFFDGIEFPWHFISVQPGKLGYAEPPTILLEISTKSLTILDHMLLEPEASIEACVSAATKGPRQAARLHLAWLMWCYQQGYTNPIDREGLHNHMADDASQLTKHDVIERDHLLAMADEVLDLLSVSSVREHPREDELTKCAPK